MFREQLFFIAFGRLWARAMKPATAVSGVLKWFMTTPDGFPVRFNAYVLIHTHPADIELMELCPISLSSLKHSSVARVQSSILQERSSAYFGDR